jgi:hypothetical protein
VAGVHAWRNGCPQSEQAHLVPHPFRPAEYLEKLECSSQSSRVQSLRRPPLQLQLVPYTAFIALQHRCRPAMPTVLLDRGWRVCPYRPSLFIRSELSDFGQCLSPARLTDARMARQSLRLARQRFFERGVEITSTSLPKNRWCRCAPLGKVMDGSNSVNLNLCDVGA